MDSVSVYSLKFLFVFVFKRKIKKKKQNKRRELKWSEEKNKENTFKNKNKIKKEKKEKLEFKVVVVSLAWLFTWTGWEYYIGLGSGLAWPELNWTVQVWRASIVRCLVFMAFGCFVELVGRFGLRQQFYVASGWQSPHFLFVFFFCLWLLSLLLAMVMCASNIVNILLAGFESIFKCNNWRCCCCCCYSYCH